MPYSQFSSIFTKLRYLLVLVMEGCVPNAENHAKVMHVLVAGAAGFVGSHFCRRLLADGHEVTALDNFITSSPENIEDLLDKNFKFRQYDITNYVHIPGKLDAIVHLASPASPVDYLAHPIHTLKVGALGTLHLLGLAKEKKARFLLASTSEVYGDPLVHPQPESYWGNVNPVGIRGVYDEAKRFAEALSMAYHREHGLHIKIARIFNTYGPNMRLLDGRVIPNFIAQALQGKPLTVYGDGKQTRSFCYVDDLVEGLIRYLKSDFQGQMNLGNPNEFTVLKLADLILKQITTGSKIAYCPLPEDDPKLRRPDISRAKEILKWEPKTSLEDGLKKTVAWFSGRLEASLSRT
jgi:dTDP-glucose 4,6-dehydratase